MSNIVWGKEPKLKTSGFICKFTKKIEFQRDLQEQNLSQFLTKWKLYTYLESRSLYQGTVYRKENISPNHLILQVKKRGGNAYQYIDCKYNKELRKITFEIKAPNAAGYFYIFWPLILLAFLTLLKIFDWQFTIFHIGFFFLCAALAIVLGMIFLHLSMSSTKNDLKRDFYRTTGHEIEKDKFTN